MRKVDVFDGDGIVVDESHTATISIWTGRVSERKIWWKEKVNGHLWTVRVEPGFIEAKEVDFVVMDDVF